MAKTRHHGTFIAMYIHVSELLNFFQISLNLTKHKLPKCFLLLLTFNYFWVSAQPINVQIDTVIITDKYPLLVWGNTQIIDSTQQQLYVTASVADYLSRSAGVYVKNYGGSSLATVGLRGLSAQHTQVSWNGIPVNSPMLGLIDASLLPTGGNDKVQVCYGNAALQEQNGAIGGAIVLQSKPQFNQTLNTQLYTQVGSFDNYQALAKLNAGTKNWYGNVNVMGRWAANDYLYHNLLLPNKPLTRQQPENAQQYNLNAELYHKISPLHTLAARYWGNYTTRHLQPPIVGSNFNEQQTDQAQRLMLQWDGWTNSKRHHHLQATAALLNDYLWYNNDTVSIESQNHSRTYFAQTTSQHRLASKWQLNTRVSYQQSAVYTNNYGNNKPPIQQQLGGFAKCSYQPNNRLNAELLLRSQQFDNRPILFLPAFAVAYMPTTKPNTQWQFNVSTALNARIPTLNDRYWYPGGNLNLTHESGFTQEIGTTYRQKMRKNIHFDTHITLYYTHINNLIVWLPINGAIWQAQNRKSVAASGIEWQTNANIKRKTLDYNLHISYTFSRSINLKPSSSIDNSVGKQLPYVPLHSLYVRAQINRKNYGLLYENTLISQRYTTTDNSTSNTLAPYLLANLHAMAQWRWQQITIKANLSVNNLLNVTYYPVNYRPAPLRSVAIGCSVGW